ncbi:MAG: MBL fold metallo-hydrolase [Gammaproteobacteria bacterium]|nr:MBL fold metallo-hydrolase [Gammaproteobacteria bacterium]
MAAATSRRQLLGGAAAGAAALAWPFRSRAAGNVTVTPVVGELSVLTGAGGNIVVLATDQGHVVVDSGAAASSGDVVATLGELGGNGTAALFNTHWHLDQVGGNDALGRAGATIFAHEKTRLRLKTGYYVQDEDRYEAALPAPALPTETIYEEGSAEFGGRQVDYAYLIEAHTDGDIYVAFPDLNVIAVGDVVSQVRDPVFDWFGGGWLGGRVDALAHLLEISDDETRFVPSYGPVVARADVMREHEMMLTLFDRFVERIRLGETAADMHRAGAHEGLGRDFDDPMKLLYDIHTGFWAHHNKLMHDIV